MLDAMSMTILPSTLTFPGSTHSSSILRDSPVHILQLQDLLRGLARVTPTARSTMAPRQGQAWGMEGAGPLACNLHVQRQRAMGRLPSLETIQRPHPVPTVLPPTPLNSQGRGGGKTSPGLESLPESSPG